VRPGSIILLHPWYRGREPSRAALPAIIDGLRTEGYELVTVSELLRAAAGPRRAGQLEGTGECPRS
jgi:peptidoglycan/xylan/chitin deacetylase (PgdA/CDA1 family)